jgi:alpha-galactosidase
MKITTICLGVLMSSVLTASSALAEVKVFLLAGQSNMAGLGGYTGYPLGKPWDDPPYDHADLPCPAPYDKPQTEVKFWNYGAKPGDDHANVLKAGDAWVDLQPGFGHRDDGFGPEVSFGYQLKKLYPKDDIYLIKSSTGGTNLAVDWNPNPDSMGPQYKLFKTRVDAALANLTAAGKKPTIAGMIWMQGEDDSTNPAFAKAYQENLLHFIKKVREDFKAPEMKFVIGRITYMAKLWTSTETIDIVRAAQQKAAEVDGNAAWFDTDDLKWSYYGHYGTNGQIELGCRFAKELAPAKKDGEEKKTEK